MLLATLAYPFGYDQAVFSTAGDMILHGAVPYRDFLDTKPPLIYYLYASAIAIFGRDEWSIHAFDLTWQLVTAYYFFRILRRYFPADYALLAVSLTVILYAGSGFWMTAQAESFATLPSLLLLDTTLRAGKSSRRTLLYGVLAGSASIVLLALKFTLVLGGAAALLFILSEPREWSGHKLRFVLGFTGSAGAGILLGVGALWRAGAAGRLLQSLGWLSDYAALVPNQRSWLEVILVIFPERIVYSTSIALTLFGIAGFVWWLRRKHACPEDRIFRLLAITSVLQLFGILLERKIEFPYQYTRAVWAVTPFMAGAIIFLAKKVSVNTTRRAVVSVVGVLIALVLSPLPRIFTQTIPWSCLALHSQNAASEVQRRVPDYFAEEQREVARYLDRSMTKQDQLFFWGNDVAIYFLANRLPQTICLTATPLRTSFTPHEWKDTLVRQLDRSKPKYWIVEFGDARPSITGSASDSYEALLQWPELEISLFSHYKADTTIGHFSIFERRN